MRSTAITIALLLLRCLRVDAQTVTLPLNGYYRLGRNMPVEVDVGSESSLTIKADGAVPIVLSGVSGRQTVPLLTVGSSVGTISIGDVVQSTASLHPLETHDTLIGIIGDPTSGERFARNLFPVSKRITLPLNAPDPLPGRAIAWQSLDGIVVIDPWPAGLDLSKLGDWLASGIAIAVRSDDPPDAKLPWRPIVGGWVLRPNIAGPLGCDGNDEAYAPSAAWHPDLAAIERYQIVAAAVVIAILLIVASLLARRFRMPAQMMIVIGALLVIAWVRQRQPQAFEGSGDIEVTRAGWQQRDQWRFIARRRGGEMNIACIGDIWPVFLDAEQPQRLHMALHDDAGDLRFTFELPPDNRLAIMARALRPAPADASTQPKGTRDLYSPMSRLARSLYRDAGDPYRIGESESAANQPATEAPNTNWPTVECRSN